MPTNAMGREAANPGKGSIGGPSNADRDRDASKALGRSLGARSPNPNRFGPRYEKKKARAFEATMSNLAQVGGTILGAMSGPIGTAVNTAAQTIAGVDPLNPFEKPTGTVDTYSYDPTNRAGSEPAKQPEVKLAPTKPKKKKPTISGFTLLADMPGTLLGT